MSSAQRKARALLQQSGFSDVNSAGKRPGQILFSLRRSLRGNGNTKQGKASRTAGGDA